MTIELVKTTPFDPDMYEVEQQLLRDYMAELSYVDRVLALRYIHDVDGEFFGFEHPMTAYVDIGETHPFKRSRNGIEEGIWPGRVEDDLQRARAEATAWADSNMETLSALTAPILHPKTQTYDAIDDAFEDVASLLEDDVATPFTRLDQTISHWSGGAAIAFGTNFYAPFKNQILENQQYYVRSSQLAFRVSKAIAQIAQHSLMTIVVTAKEAAEEQLKFRAASTETTSAKELLILAAGSASLVAALNFSGAAVFAAATTGLVLEQIAERVPETTADHFTVQGASADELFNTLYDGVRQILQNLRTQYEALELELQELRARASDMRVGGGLVPIRPGIADGVDPGEFFHDTSSRYQE